MADKKINPLNYLAQELNGKGDFMQQYKTLNESDKTTLKHWADEEQTALGRV